MSLYPAEIIKYDSISAENRANFVLLVISQTSNQPIKLRHRTRLDGIHDVDIRLHSLVVGVTGPFHDDIGRDAHGEGIDDKGAATGVGADQFPLGLDLVSVDVALVGGDEGDLPILLKSVSFPQLLLHLGLLMCEIILPPRAEVDMPPPEAADQRLRIPIIMCPQLAVLARVCFCLSHGFDVSIGLKIRKYSFAMTNRSKTVKRLRPGTKSSRSHGRLLFNTLKSSEYVENPCI